MPARFIAGSRGTADEKQAALRDAGAVVSESPADIGDHLMAILGK